VTGVVYAREQTLSAEDYAAVIGATYMHDRRPIHNLPRVREILAGSNVIMTAREPDGTILGLARGISDGAWVCYIADLAVREGQQRRGIGTGIMDELRRSLGPRIGIVLMAYPQAVDYYRRIGMEEMTAFYYDREDRA
jgi:ribosomal protein S18 acetylase RimI-like enzyme